jgi:hypothetical protein
VHVAGLPTDEGFVRFDLAGEFVDGSHTQSMTDSVIHEPRGFLSDADSAVNLVGTHAVPAIHNLPHCGKPFIQTKRGVLKNSPGLRGELPVVVAAPTLPAVVLLHEGDLLASAPRAGDAVRPAPRYNVLTAIDGIGKVYDGLLEECRVRAPYSKSSGNHVICQIKYCPI